MLRYSLLLEPRKFVFAHNQSAHMPFVLRNLEFAKLNIIISSLALINGETKTFRDGYGMYNPFETSLGSLFNHLPIEEQAMTLPSLAYLIICNACNLS